MQKKTGLCPRLSMFSSKSVSDGHTHSARFYQRTGYSHRFDQWIRRKLYIQDVWKEKPASVTATRWISMSVKGVTLFSYLIEFHWNRRFSALGNLYKTEEKSLFSPISSRNVFIFSLQRIFFTKNCKCHQRLLHLSVNWNRIILRKETNGTTWI